MNKRSLLDRLLCFIGCHEWDQPGGNCVKCGKHDDFFDRFPDCDGGGI